MKRYLLTVASLAITFQGFSQDVEKLIVQADVEKTISILAADDMQGRGTFSSGIGKAAQYIESQFKAVELKPLADNTLPYYQPFN